MLRPPKDLAETSAKAFSAQQQASQAGHGTDANLCSPAWLNNAPRSPLTCVLLVWGMLFLALGICLALFD